MLSIVFAGTIIIAIFLIQVTIFYKTFEKDVINNEYFELLAYSVVVNLFFDFVLVSFTIGLSQKATEIGLW